MDSHAAGGAKMQRTVHTDRADVVGSSFTENLKQNAASLLLTCLRDESAAGAN